MKKTTATLETDMQRDINVNSAAPQDTLDLQPTIWERITKPDRIHSYQLGVGQDYPKLNEIVLGMSQNVNVEDLGDMKIYRIDTLEHIFSSIVRGKLRLSNPVSWEDPWEDSLWRTVGRLDTSDTGKYDCFAQCWSINPSCEALWGRFKSKGRTIRIETTIKKLLSSIRIPNDDDKGDIDNQFFISKVMYLNEDEQKQFRQEILQFIGLEEVRPNFDLVRVVSLFAKRKPFEYEKEVRLVFRPIRDTSGCRMSFEFDWAPITSIESLQLDPWCSSSEHEVLAKLLSSIGLRCTRSELWMPIVSL